MHEYGSFKTHAMYWMQTSIILLASVPKVRVEVPQRVLSRKKENGRTIPTHNEDNQGGSAHQRHKEGQTREYTPIIQEQQYHMGEVSISF